jgi:demethylmenaquinone methyltransferase/2-methoxy-6-polyprenyl-1,4-benzoquinol methylase
MGTVKGDAVTPQVGGDRAGAGDRNRETDGGESRPRDTLIPRSAVRAMFDRVAPRYDLLNRVLSLGIDRRWRQRAIASLGLRPGDLIVDVCGGTGDLALTALRQVTGVRALNVDFSQPMLRLAHEKRGNRPLASVRGDAVQVPIATGVAAGVVIGFGIRNVANRLDALRECHRLLRPGGRVAIVEFGTPRLALVRTLYLAYLRHLLPRIAALATDSPGAYAYLGDSILDFPERDAFAELLARAGFDKVGWTDLTLGIAVLYTGKRQS